MPEMWKREIKKGINKRVSMAKEHNVCTNANECSDEGLAEMTDLMLERDGYNSRMWLRVMLSREHWRRGIGPVAQ